MIVTAETSVTELLAWLLRLHLFITASRFSAMLETSIHAASSGAGIVLSTLLSPTFSSRTAAAGSLEYVDSNLVSAPLGTFFARVPSAGKQHLSRVVQPIAIF